MIRAWIFDLDGTLVQTERLKAWSYERAAVELCPHDISEGEVFNAFKDVVGRSRAEVAQSLVERFELEGKASARMADFGVQTPWQAFVQVRLRHYEAMLDDPEILIRNQWPHNVELLKQARREGCKTALATMSGCERTTQVLDVLGLADEFDFVATRDDVDHGKPDPEIYRLTTSALAIPPEESLVIEDSPSGVKAALGAGVNVIAVSTPFTRKTLHAADLLPEERIVDDPETLPDVLERFMREHEREVHM
ncbi:MAG: HAD-IA family hydrolase [Anaerolineales bacterium]|nr:HAD-IA family hydrolase [Anaerolineales bacterium]